MAIPENQLDTWAHQGSVIESSTTYATIKNALESASATYAAQDCEVFLQGSYGNNTNVYADSDVDVVIQLNSLFYYDVIQVPEALRAGLQGGFGTTDYSHSQFKTAVLSRLNAAFPNQVTPGTKALLIAATNNRRKADVLVAAQFRHYYLMSGHTVPTYHQGICFFTPNGMRVVNYPKLHSARCTEKHQSTAQWFKPVVRIFKNMRNRAITDGRLAAGVAPSYYLEGMLYNVPTDRFGTNYAQNVERALVWLRDCDRTSLTTASGRHYLVRDNSQIAWSSADFETFLSTMIDQWTRW